MSAKDSVGDKLVASIQKTKAEAGTQAAGESKPQAAPPKPAVKKAAAKKPKTKKAAAKKAVSTKKAAARAPKAKPASGSFTSNKKQLTDAFQHGRRVWPD